MSELVVFSRHNGISPRGDDFVHLDHRIARSLISIVEALQLFANNIREADPARLMHTTNHMLPMDMSAMNGVAPSPSVTLYQNSPRPSMAVPQPGRTRCARSSATSWHSW